MIEETGEIPLNEELVDEAMRQHLTDVLKSVVNFGDFLCMHSSPLPHSELAKESHALTGVETWSTAVEAGIAATDHLHYFVRTTLNMRVIAPFASFTLLRSAISAAALAGWLLEGDSNERLLRTLQLRRLEAVNHITALNRIVNAVREPNESNQAKKRRADSLDRRRQAEAIRAEIDKDAADLKFPSKAVSSMPRDGELVKIAARLTPRQPHHDFDPTDEAVMVWQLLSSYAHGQSWAADISAQVSSIGGRQHKQWAPDQEFLMLGLYVAGELMKGAFDRYITLAGREIRSQ